MIRNGNWVPEWNQIGYYLSVTEGPIHAEIFRDGQYRAVVSMRKDKLDLKIDDSSYRHIDTAKKHAAKSIRYAKKLIESGFEFRFNQDSRTIGIRESGCHFCRLFDRPGPLEQLPLEWCISIGETDPFLSAWSKSRCPHCMLVTHILVTDETVCPDTHLFFLKNVMVPSFSSGGVVTAWSLKGADAFVDKIREATGPVTTERMIQKIAEKK